MDQQALKAVFDEYFYEVYYQTYRENGFSLEGMFDPELLSYFGLPPDSSIEDIKRKFRELAKQYHPDHGGDSNKFIKLMEIYEKLINDQ